MSDFLIVLFLSLSSFNLLPVSVTKLLVSPGTLRPRVTQHEYHGRGFSPPAFQLGNPKTIYSGLSDEMLATWGISWLELVVYGMSVLA